MRLFEATKFFLLRVYIIYFIKDKDMFSFCNYKNDPFLFFL